MKRFLPLIALTAAALIAHPAFAEQAGQDQDTSATLPVDATGTSDAGATDAGVTDAASTDAGPSQEDAGALDTVSPPDDATGTSGSFNVNPCWDEKCPTETQACKDHAYCGPFVLCTKTDKSANDCATELKFTKAINEEVAKLLTAISNCGYPACADPSGSSCTKPGKGGAANRCGQFDDAWKCNCDLACSQPQFNDCCADFVPYCKPTCGGGKCGKAPAAGDVCGCSEQCETDKNCCSDYEALCKPAACEPKCAADSCGDDGCGGTCACTGGKVCDTATKLCGAKSEPDAGASVDTAVPADTGASTDAGGTTTAATPKKDSGGCTAAPTSHGALPFGLVLLMLAGVVLLRRRDA